MSLENKFNSPTPSTIIINEVVRNPKTESFGDSFFHDMAAAMGPAANITNSIYRKKALKAIAKRNRVYQNRSEYIDMLSKVNVGNNYSVSGNMTESNLFDYITRYCKMEIEVYKRNKALGNDSPKIVAKLQNPPDLNMGHLSRMQYCNSIILTCKIDRLKAWFKKLTAGKKE